MIKSKQLHHSMKQAGISILLIGGILYGLTLVVKPVAAATCPAINPPVIPQPNVTLPVPATYYAKHTFTWNPVPGAVKYWFRLDSDTPSWSGFCNQLGPGDQCFNEVLGNSITLDLVKGKKYDWWVHAVNSCQPSATATHGYVTVPSVAPPPPTAPPGCYEMNLDSGQENGTMMHLAPPGQTSPNSLQLSGAANTLDIKSVTFKFFNRENGGKPIMYQNGVPFVKTSTQVQTGFMGRKYAVVPLTYAELARPDYNWLDYRNEARKPITIDIGVVFTDSAGRTSNINADCTTDEETYNRVTVTLEYPGATPTPAPGAPMCYSFRILTSINESVVEAYMGPSTTDYPDRGTLGATATTQNVTKATFHFINPDNGNKPIRYGANPYVVTTTQFQVGYMNRKSASLGVTYDALHQPDLNWLGPNNQPKRPKRVEVLVQFENAAGQKSNMYERCLEDDHDNNSVLLTLIDPTVPTSSPTVSPPPSSGTPADNPTVSPSPSPSPTEAPVAGVCQSIKTRVTVKNPKDGYKVHIKYRLLKETDNTLFKEIPINAQTTEYALAEPIPFPCSIPSNTSTDGNIIYAEIRDPQGRWVSRTSRRYMCATITSSCEAPFVVDLSINKSAECVCQAADTGMDVCSSSCQFRTSDDPRVTYANPMHCELKVQEAPVEQSAADSWCNRPERTIGDADGDGRPRWKDYYWYRKMTKPNAKVPATINADFNGDGEISDVDGLIILKELGRVF